MSLVGRHITHSKVHVITICTITGFKRPCTRKHSQAATALLINHSQKYLQRLANTTSSNDTSDHDLLPNVNAANFKEIYNGTSPSDPIVEVWSRFCYVRHYNEPSIYSLFVFNQLISQDTMQPYLHHSAMVPSGAKHIISLHPVSTRGAFSLYMCASRLAFRNSPLTFIIGHRR